MSEPSKPNIYLHQTNPRNRMGWWVNECSNLSTTLIMCTDNYHSHWQCKTRRQTGAVLLYNLRDLKASTIPVHAYPNLHLIGSPTLPGTITIPHTPNFPTSDPTPTFRPSFILQFFHCGPFQGLIHDNRETPKSINQDSKSDNISIFSTMSWTNPWDNLWSATFSHTRKQNTSMWPLLMKTGSPAASLIQCLWYMWRVYQLV